MIVLLLSRYLVDNRSMQQSSKPAESGVPIYFDPIKVGTSLKEVGVDFQEIDEKEIVTRWFRDQKSETDVFVWMNKDRKIIKQQISVMGQLVEWNILEGVRTGVILESEFSSQNLMENGLTSGDSASEIIRFDKTTQLRTLELGLSILKHTTCVEPELMGKMIDNFNQGFSFRAFASLQDLHVSKNPLVTRIKKFFLSCFRK